MRSTAGPVIEHSKTGVSHPYNKWFRMNSEPQNPYVQVIVPARNEQECIGRCLQSLVSQQGIDFQITVVDDCSTDRTRAIAESFAGVRVIGSCEPTQGVRSEEHT